MNPREKDVRSKPHASLQQGRQNHRAGKFAKATDAASKALSPTTFVAEKPGEQWGWQPSSSVLLLSSSNPRQYASSEHAALSQVILRIKDTRTKFHSQTQS